MCQHLSARTYETSMVLHMFDLPGFDRSKIVPMRVRISLYIPQDITSCWRSLQIEVHLYGIMSQRRVIGHNKKSEQGLEPRDVRHLTCNFALLEKERRLGTRRRFVIGVVNQCVVKTATGRPFALEQMSAFIYHRGVSKVLRASGRCSSVICAAEAL